MMATKEMEKFLEWINSGLHLLKKKAKYMLGYEQTWGRSDRAKSSGHPCQQRPSFEEIWTRTLAKRCLSLQWQGLGTAGRSTPEWQSARWPSPAFQMLVLSRTCRGRQVSNKPGKPFLNKTCQSLHKNKYIYIFVIGSVCDCCIVHLLRNLT